jgi:alpha-beta hydrolase superfamily lysophospholipase
MPGLKSFVATVAAAATRWGRRAVWFLVVLAFAVVLGFTSYAVTTLPDLAPWHTEILRGEFSARRPGGPQDFAGYQQLEAALFATAARRAADWTDLGDAYTYSRFNPASKVQRLAAGAPFNRSFRLSPEVPVGSALLVHGLTDSPYSMKALAESLYRRGFEVTVLRLPGHGTWPSMLTRVTHDDWVAAVRLATRDVAGRTPAGQPFYVGGYSTGATLTLAYALDSLADTSLRRPDRVLLVSPAIEISSLATLANVMDLLAILPVQAVQKVRWQSVQVEFDPYKFNSFPVNGTRQVNRATKELQKRLAAAAASGQLRQLPAVVTWQSVADSTVGATGTLDRLYARLDGERHQLVLFDTNRQGNWQLIESPRPRALVNRLVASPRAYTLHLVSNQSGGDAPVTVQRYRPGETTAENVPTTLAWPADTVSLGHVALPFPPDDPVYGYLAGSGHAGIRSLGSLLLRGEAGATTIALGSLTRLRSNPFWALIDQQVGELVAADLAAPATGP